MADIFSAAATQPTGAQGAPCTWPTLAAHAPAPLLDALLHGALGKRHLSRAADLAGAWAAQLDRDAQADAFLAASARQLACELLLAAWEGDMLDGGLAARALTLAERGLPHDWTRLLRLVAGSWRAPADPGEYAELLAAADMDATRGYLSQQIGLAPRNLFWAQQALALGAYDLALDWLQEQFSRLSLPAPLEDKLRGDLHFFRQDYTAAAQAYAAAARYCPFPGLRVRLAESLLRAGKPGQASSLWQMLLTARPWWTNLLLRLHDLATGLDRARAALPGQAAVLLYTFNKAGDLANTLDALAPGLDRSGSLVRLVVLDNGSRDETAAVIARAVSRFGADRCVALSLPVNIGAPAARNWLMQLPELADCDWFAYLDDDALVPADWLECLGAAVAAYPDAGVWGCRVVDARNPFVLQHADLQLCDPPDPQPQDDAVAPIYRARFALSRVHHEVLDQGDFAYARPCASVTGCCHLFRRERLLELGGFDLRFTPSQYDDVDHDLRLCLRGSFPVYQGHLVVRHAKRSGRSSLVDASELARSNANYFKLQRRLTPEDVASLQAALRNRLVEDLLEKQQRLLAAKDQTPGPRA